MRGRSVLVVTASGWVVVAAALIGVLAGLAFGWSEFLVIGATALLVAGIAALFLLGRSDGDIALSVLERQVVAGSPATVVLRSGDGSGRRVRAQDAELPVGDRIETVRLPSVPPGETREATVQVATRQRGVIALGPVTLVRRDPLGLARRESPRSSVVQLYVHPPTVGLSVATSGLLRDLEGIATSDLTDSDISFHALRPYVPGDDRRHIHWKSTAKTGDFLVRQFEQTRRSHLIVLQSVAETDYASAEEFELAVSVVASIGVRSIADGTTLSVFAGAPRSRTEAGRLRSRGRRELLDDLSGIGLQRAASTVTALTRVVAEQVQDASLVFVACGSTVSARQLRASAAQFPAGVEVVAVVVDPEAPSTLVRIDALRILRIGYLDDLVRGLVRAVAA